MKSRFALKIAGVGLIPLAALTACTGDSDTDASRPPADSPAATATAPLPATPGARHSSYGEPLLVRPSVPREWFGGPGWIEPGQFAIAYGLPSAMAVHAQEESGIHRLTTYGSDGIVIDRTEDPTEFTPDPEDPSSGVLFVHHTDGNQYLIHWQSSTEAPTSGQGSEPPVSAPSIGETGTAQEGGDDDEDEGPRKSVITVFDLETAEATLRTFHDGGALDRKLSALVSITGDDVQVFDPTTGEFAPPPPPQNTEVDDSFAAETVWMGRMYGTDIYSREQSEVVPAGVSGGDWELDGYFVEATDSSAGPFLSVREGSGFGADPNPPLRVPGACRILDVRTGELLELSERMTGACVRGSFDQSYHGSFIAADPENEMAIISEDGTELAIEQNETAFRVWTLASDGLVYGTMSERGIDFMAVYDPAKGGDPQLREDDGVVLIPREVSGNGIAHFSTSSTGDMFMLKRER